MDGIFLFPYNLAILASDRFCLLAGFALFAASGGFFEALFGFLFLFGRGRFIG